jgi:hypothetical protein
VRRGSTVGYVECEITDESARLIAKAASTCLVLKGDRAKGHFSGIFLIESVRLSHRSCWMPPFLRYTFCPLAG